MAPGRSVSLLWFLPSGAEDEDGLLVGVYETPAAARLAIERLREKPGFADHPSGFQIHQREVGRDAWPDGYTVDGEPEPPEEGWV